MDLVVDSSPQSFDVVHPGWVGHDHLLSMYVSKSLTDTRRLNIVVLTYERCLGIRYVSDFIKQTEKYLLRTTQDQTCVIQDVSKI